MLKLHIVISYSDNSFDGLMIWRWQKWSWSVSYLLMDDLNYLFLFLSQRRKKRPLLCSVCCEKAKGLRRRRNGCGSSERINCWNERCTSKAQAALKPTEKKNACGLYLLCFDLYFLICIYTKIATEDKMPDPICKSLFAEDIK